MTWATERLNMIKSGDATPPPVVETLRLGLLDDWGRGWAEKLWHPSPEVLQSDGSMFGGYLAALADQILAFSALSVVPETHAFRTANLSLQFFRLAWGEPIFVRADVVVQSAQVIHAEALLRLEDGTLIAKASAQQITTRLPQK